MVLFPAEPLSVCKLPFYLVLVPAGFPSPATEFVEGKLDLNEHLIHRPAATFFVRVVGDSMIGEQIRSGDLAVVDRSLTPGKGDIVVAIVNGELTIKTLQWRGGRNEPRDLRLEAANPAYGPITIADGDDFQIWGVVTATIHQRRRADK